MKVDKKTLMQVGIVALIVVGLVLLGKFLKIVFDIVLWFVVMAAIGGFIYLLIKAFNTDDPATYLKNTFVNFFSKENVNKAKDVFSEGVKQVKDKFTAQEAEKVEEKKEEVKEEVKKEAEEIKEAVKEEKEEK